MAQQPLANMGGMMQPPMLGAGNAAALQGGGVMNGNGQLGAGMQQPTGGPGLLPSIRNVPGLGGQLDPNNAHQNQKFN